MATFYSDQRTDLRAQPAKMLRRGMWGGRLRTFQWTYTTPASGAPAVADVIELVELPVDFIVLGVYVASEAMSSGAGTAGFDLGDADDADRYVAAENVDAAINKWLTLRLGTNLGFMYRISKASEQMLKATVTGEAWATSKLFKGFVVGAHD